MILNEPNPPAAVCTGSWPSNTPGTGNQGYWAIWEISVKISPRENRQEKFLGQTQSK